MNSKYIKWTWAKELNNTTTFNIDYEKLVKFFFVFVLFDKEMIEINLPVSAVKKINITIGVDSLCVYIFLRRVYGSGSDLGAITLAIRYIWTRATVTGSNTRRWGFLVNFREKKVSKTNVVWTYLLRMSYRTVKNNFQHLRK